MLCIAPKIAQAIFVDCGTLTKEVGIDTICISHGLSTFIALVMIRLMLIIIPANNKYMGDCLHVRLLW